MKKFNLKSSLCGFMAGIIVAAAVPVMAYNGTRSISAAFKNIKIYIDGAELTPRDSNGNVLEPFIYNGSTYLPIRAVGEAVGKSVSYDANTNSVYLGSSGSSGSTTSQGTKLEPYQTSRANIEDLQMGGITYKDALELYNGGGEAYYNLAGAYNTVSGLCGSVDNSASSDREATISFYGDGILLKEITMNSGTLPENFAINVTGVSQFTVKMDANYIDLKMGIADMYFK